MQHLRQRGQICNDNFESLLVESAVFPSLFVCRLFVRTLAEMTSSVTVCAKLVKRSPCTLESFK